MMRWSRSRSQGGRATLALLGAACLVAASGCATAQGGVPGDLSRAASAAASAASTGGLALELFRADKATATVTDTALTDSLTKSQDAEVAAATVVVGTVAEQRPAPARSLPSGPAPRRWWRRGPGSPPRARAAPAPVC